MNTPVRIVITGGPGAGKTAFLEILRRNVCRHVAFVQEAASVVFGGGFPRSPEERIRRGAQRAIVHVQRELESIVDPTARVVICDRGTLDGIAYWPGSEQEFFRSLSMERAIEMLRYDAVIHLRPPSGDGYTFSNPIRIESPREAADLDAKIEGAWRGHPQRFFVESTADYLEKAQRAMTIVRGLLPPRCTIVEEGRHGCEAEDVAAA